MFRSDHVPPPGSAVRAHPDRRTVLQRAAGMGAVLLGTSRAEAAPAGDTRRGVFDVTTFGASAVRGDNATRAFQAAIDACAAAGGGVVYAPPGAYTVGTIQLKDNVTLHVEAGATLFLSQNRADFPAGRDAMIYAEDAAHIGLVGRGMLDGVAEYVFTAMRDRDPEIDREVEIARAAGMDMRRYYRNSLEAFLVLLNGCRDVLLRDISVVRSPLWSVRLNDCDRVRIEAVYIHSDLEQGVNADGIDMVSSRNVAIADSIIETADDAIVLKTFGRHGRPAQPTENVTVTNCVLTSSSTPLMIGTETEADIRHVLFNNCVIRNSNKGFGINVQDGATVSGIVFSNLTIETSRRHWNWWGSSEMCKFVLRRRTPESPLGAIRDIVIDTVIARTRGTSTIAGDPERPLENLTLSNIRLTMLEENAADKRAADALRIEQVHGLRMRGVTIEWAGTPPEPKWRSALVLRHVTGFDLDGLAARQGLENADTPAIVLGDAADGDVVNARAARGCRQFIHVAGAGTRDLAIRGLRVPKGTIGVTFESDAVRSAVRTS